MKGFGGEKGDPRSGRKDARRAESGASRELALGDAKGSASRGCGFVRCANPYPPPRLPFCRPFIGIGCNSSSRLVTMSLFLFVFVGFLPCCVFLLCPQVCVVFFPAASRVRPKSGTRSSLLAHDDTLAETQTSALHSLACSKLTAQNEMGNAHGESYGTRTALRDATMRMKCRRKGRKRPARKRTQARGRSRRGREWMSRARAEGQNVVF